MLTYTHIYNSTNSKLPYNIACIDSNSTNIAIYINNKLQEIVSPNKATLGLEFTIYKQKLDTKNILDILYSGTIISYSNAINKVIFSDSNVVYVKSSLGKFLNLDINNIPYWSSTTKSKFFFNPYYFDSGYLWQKIFSTGIFDSSKVSGLWNLPDEIDLFNRRTLNVSTEIIPVKIKPFRFNYFDHTSFTTQITIDKVLEIKANTGDIVSLKTDKDRIEFTYEPISASAMIVPDIDGTTCSRPWIHIPLRFIDPNSESLYTKILNKGTNNFDIKVTVEDKSFTKNITIFR